ncbi:MAG: hypothetical protein H6815_04005 [Phycisphaeraceae bacterium]|nr:hypothetical protein [Phycisphaerales bacterium]MCB9859594.1 hypothetical protein [Phycisphaeraceae bacterium]
MGGCSSLAGMPNDPQQLTQQIGQRLDELDAKYEQTEHAIIARIDLMNQTDIPADDPSRLAMESMLAETQTMRSALETARAKLVQVARETEAITSGTGLVFDTFNRLSVLIPEPIRSPVVLGVGLIAALLRARTMRRGLESVAKSVDKVMEADPEFASRFVKHADTVRTIQTQTARKVIDQTLATKFQARLPI